MSDATTKMIIEQDECIIDLKCNLDRHTSALKASQENLSEAYIRITELEQELESAKSVHDDNEAMTITEHKRIAELESQRETLCSRIDNLKVLTQWQPIETAPENTLILINICPYGYPTDVVETGRYVNGEFYDSSGRTCTVNHWKPLGPPPEIK